MSSTTKVEHPRRDGLYRAARTGVELRAAQDGTMPTLVGHFAVFDQPTEIASFFEGNFIERIAPGAFKKTFRENKDSIKCLFQHGCDPDIGNKPLGPVSVLREDETGAYYEVPLIDADYVRGDVLPGLEAGLYGASFCFEVIKEEFDEEPAPSADNPRGLPERTLLEVRVPEFGPVTFPAYEGATAGVRSITTRIAIEQRGADVMDQMFGTWATRNPERARSLVVDGEYREVIPYKKTPTSEEPWDGPANRKNLPSPLPVEKAREAFAWIDESAVEDGMIAKDKAKFIHHLVSEDGTVGDADVQACSTGIGVLNGEMQGTTIPDADRQGVYDHLSKHLEDAGKEPPELKARNADPESAETRWVEDAITALIDAGFTRESAADALNVEALRKESSEPAAEATPEATDEVADEQDPAADGEPADALLGADDRHSDRSRDQQFTNEHLPPWREDESRTPPWRAQED
jgi:HK97 family phage prohead protease